MLRLAIVAAIPAVRAGVRALLDGDGIRVVGEAATLAALAPALQEADVLLVADDLAPTEAARLLPDGVALLFLGDSRAAVAALRALAPRTWGLLPLDASNAALRAAILALGQGLTVLPPPLAAPLLGSDAGAEALVEPLTSRELEVLEQVSYGLANKEIARALQISEHTVKFHLSAIFGTLGASSRTEAVSRGARLGLIVL